MPAFDFLKKMKSGKKSKSGAQPKEHSVDMDKVEEIVKKMKKKYREEGVELEQVGGKLGELRGIVAEGEAADIEVQPVEDLQEFKSPLIRSLGSMYLSFRSVTEPVSKLLRKVPGVKEIDTDLYSANMHYSVNQYIAMTTAAALAVAVLGFIGATLFLALFEMELAFKVILVPVIAVFCFFFTAAIALLMPRRNAQIRGELISRELPFALRHMATELKAGIGLYRTIQAIAASGYGALSEEFARAITEVEEGTDTKLALRRLALRTRSTALRNALMHIIRAMKTGGNLSEIMNDIAEDVSFQLQIKLREFSQKMNFFGVIYIFIAIVAPVIISVLGGIRNSPIGTSGISIFSALPLTIDMLAVVYLIALPMVLVLLIIYLMMSQPKV